MLLIELLSLSFLFLGADGLHIVRPFVNNGEIVGFAVLDMASIASYNQAIVLVEDNTSNLRLFRLDHWPLIIDLEPVNLVNLDHLDDALLLVVFSTFTLRSVVIEVLAGDKDQKFLSKAVLPDGQTLGEVREEIACLLIKSLLLSVLLDLDNLYLA